METEKKEIIDLTELDGRRNNGQSKKAFYRYPERVALWLEAIKLGCSYKNAATVFHVAASTVSDMLTVGRREDCDDPELKAFVEATEAAEKEFETTNLDIIKRAALRDWKAAAWLLERRIFNTYAKRDITVDGKELTKTAKITVEYVDSKSSPTVQDRIKKMEELIDSEA